MVAHRKPDGQRVHNPPSRQLATVSQIAGTAPAAAGEHPPPMGLLKQTREQWDDFWDSDVSRVVGQHHLPALIRLFEMRDAQTRALRLYKKRPMVEGSMGQPVVNPSMGTVQALEKDIRALEDRLGLTPKAQASLGIQIGTARLTAEQLNRMAEEDGREGEGDDGWNSGAGSGEPADELEAGWSEA